jgi:hypothetical protein
MMSEASLASAYLELSIAVIRDRGVIYVTAERERSTMIESAIRYFEVHPIVTSADCETRMQIPAQILRDTGL